MSRSLDRGESWSEPSTALILENDPWGNVSITPGGGGSWGVAWSTNHHVFYSDHVDTGGDVLFSRSADGGATWGAPVKVAGEEPGVGIPEHNGVDVATDGVGTWVIAWASDDTLDGRVGDWDIVVSRSTNAGSTWSAPSHVADYAIQDVHDDRFPSVASDGVGGWLLAWATSYSVPGAAGLDYDIAVSASHDGGASWTGPVTLDDSADSDRRIDGSVDLACSAPGICVAAWTSQSDIPGRRGIAVKGASRIDE
jgi:hypothetical protein